MSTPTKHQMIEHGGQPLFVIVPYEEYQELTGQKEKRGNIPVEVAEIALLEEKSLIRAWREHLGMTQERMAAKIGVTRPSFAQMEAFGAKPRRATLAKIAAALGVTVEQLED